MMHSIRNYIATSDNVRLWKSEFPCSGTCVGVVVNIGDNTVMGRIARLTGGIKEESQ